MRYALVFLSLCSTFLVYACDSGPDDGGPGTDAVTEACEAYCTAALTEPCGDTQLTVTQCKAQCSYYADQLLGVCEAETKAVFECVSAGGFECTGYDTDGDGADDTFVPTPKDQCLTEQQAQVTCESAAGCKRYCKVAGDEGCGDGCLEACEARAAELDTDAGMCSYGYQTFVGCGARLGVTCTAGKPAPSAECIDAAFSTGECLTPDDLCGAYCFAAGEIGCGSDCAAGCAARSEDTTCGSQWAGVLDCISFFGAAACEAGVLVPTADGICSSERDSYLQCAGSF